MGDIDLDDIDIHMEKQSEFAFKTNLHNGASGGKGKKKDPHSFMMDDDEGIPNMYTDVRNGNGNGHGKNMDTS